MRLETVAEGVVTADAFGDLVSMLVERKAIA